MAAEQPADRGAIAHDGFAGYADWKGWNGAFTASDRDARYFTEEFRGIALGGRRLLEIGFGNGSLLAWARGQGARVSGLEHDAGMCEAGRRAGFDVSGASLDELASNGATYDVIVAFDVLEHWDSAELVANFAAVRALLVEGGVFVARFPNGQSPFGRVYQHGDFSHKSTLSTYKIEYLARRSGLDVVRIANACRVSAKAGMLAALRQRWLALRRRRIERRIARLYGIRRLPLDPNLVAVLRRPEDDTISGHPAGASQQEQA
jgi:cyclopropane fatty-acyl-phospholipid synthase-like methyltransferase